MALPANKFLTGAFRVALWATLGAGGMAALDSPQQWLSWLRSFLKSDGRVILTTPHPSMRSIHELGARIGLFSREGAAEHRELIDGQRMVELTGSSGFRVRYFKRVLFGCNQLFILERTQ